MAAVVKPAREKKPKHKTFTGCWTCRDRKIKCDAVRPECGRCRKSNIKCEGYDVKLYWVTDQDTVPPSAIKRKAMTLQDSRMWSLQLDEVDRQIAEMDAYEATDLLRLPIPGPFNIFQVQAPSREESHYTDVDGQHYVLELDVEPGDSEHAEYDSPWDYESSDSSMTEYESRMDWQLQAAWMQEQVPVPVFGSTLSILDNPTIRRLMENYTNNIANVLPAVPHPQNPYSSIHLPKAMHGALITSPDLGDSVSDFASSDIAVFFALLATSAFHLRGADPERESEFDTIARRFRAKAFGCLRKALPGVCQTGEVLTERSQSNQFPRESVLSAMLTLVTMDVMEGSMSEYWVHLQGIDKVAQQLSSVATDSRPIQQLTTIASFLSTLAKTTSIDIPPLPWTGGPYSVPNSRSRSYVDEYGLEFTYGITPTLAHHMERIVTLSQHISYYVTKTLAVPSSLITACVDLSDELSKWSIESEPLSNLFSGTDTNMTLLLANNHILAFAHALRLYFHTRLLPCSTAEMDLYIDRVAEHLIEIEHVKATAGYGSNASATISWPGFIASCEARRGPQRQVWYRWWTGMLKYSIGNIPNLWKVVQEAWRLKDDEGSSEVPAWGPVLRRSRQHVLAV